MSDKNDLAQERTDWAEDRTVLANERTFAGWMRTGLGTVAIAIGLKAVFGPFEPTWVAKATASIFLVVAIFIYWAARARACHTLDRLHSNDAEPTSPKAMTFTASALTVGTLATGVILWAL
ncbi:MULTISPECIES: YidH family protein [Paracoccaceae]|jgi:putative membrane protein|uniref:YidH family protein n=1 Tax=Rhodobacterales TaxID=204455 RepID=UPI001B110789|nr:DUF202 domain-containing protein [Boseongicola sp. H5]MBO6603315.1 DUF202 domain-containing protein [Roseicyclus sp.]MBO6625391.1 DUF202 domain-containing protein [Roseicyclus sp.]MBO6922570.1 DUF202 domain-containing protein [Roseicyclus sp.]